MSVSVLFPGQGEPLESTLRDWYECSEPARHLIDVAAEHMEIPTARLFERGCRALFRTEVLQPVSTALSLGIFEELTQRGIEPDVVAGHSLGELAAACAAGLMGSEQAVALAALRGRLMGRESASHPGGMIVVAMSEEAEIERIVARVGSEGILAVAAYNTPSQTALSGETVLLRRVSEWLPATRLQVAGAWHSPAMAGAVDPFRSAIEPLIAGGFRIPMVFNRTGRVVSESDAVAGILADQLTHTIDWVGSMRELARLGVTDVITAGPARVLRSLVRECLAATVTIHAVEAFEDLGGCAEALAA